MTVIEIGGLLIAHRRRAGIEPGARHAACPKVPPLGDGARLGRHLGTTLLAVFAFIGFEGLVNIAEEVHDPQRTLPRAIFLTLVALDAALRAGRVGGVVAVPRGGARRRRRRRWRWCSSA